MKKIAIDLTWVRHRKVGGTEACVRNLLDGIGQIGCTDLQFYLLVSKDNAKSFELYKKNECFKLYVCDVESKIQMKRVLWQNLKMGKLLQRIGIDICLEPVYGKPFLNVRGIKFITTIHDLQAIHYPEYFSKSRVLWMKLSWWNTVHTSYKIIAISEYVKRDIIEQYKTDDNKIEVIYDAVMVSAEKCSDDIISRKYGIKQKEYYYTVSSLFLHKNLKTLVLALAELKRKKSKAFFPLVVSGIGGHSRDELDRIIESNDLKDDIIFTPFVDDAERNSLYINCKAFVFSSIFEGFGMPPIEAMALGVPVVVSTKTCLPEVTGGLANYVEDALNPIAWSNVLEGDFKKVDKKLLDDLLHRYDNQIIARQYIKLLENVINYDADK